MWNNWYRLHKGKLKKIAVLFLCVAVALYGLCFYMSYKAADIFNQVVAERQLFPGTVTVERLTATSSFLRIFTPRARRLSTYGPVTFPAPSTPSPFVSVGAWISNRKHHSIICPCC